VTEAHFVRGLIESGGLGAIVLDENLASMSGGVAVPEASPTVWVLEDSSEAEARRIVTEYASNRARSPAAGPGWRCVRCGRQLEPQFTACWACGADRSR
jgi:hypothetical protein